MEVGCQTTGRDRTAWLDLWSLCVDMLGGVGGEKVRVGLVGSDVKIMGLEMHECSLRTFQSPISIHPVKNENKFA